MPKHNTAIERDVKPRLALPRHVLTLKSIRVPKHHSMRGDVHPLSQQIPILLCLGRSTMECSSVKEIVDPVPGAPCWMMLWLYPVHLY